jgi:hypothetical protein
MAGRMGCFGDKWKTDIISRYVQRERVLLSVGPLFVCWARGGETVKGLLALDRVVPYSFHFTLLVLGCFLPVLCDDRLHAVLATGWYVEWRARVHQPMRR